MEKRELRREELVKEIVDLPVLGKTKKGGKAIGYYLKAEDILTIADFIVRREQSLQSKLEEAEANGKRLQEALTNLIYTIHLHSLTELHGDYRLVNDGELEQAISSALSALRTKEEA